MTFPLGYHSLHPDVSMNFQMNRWFGWVGEPDMLEEMRVAAPRIATYADWKREFVALAENASHQGHILRAGFYWRSAEFFMRADDPDRMGGREKFLEAVRSVYGLELGARHAVPYADGPIRAFLPAYRFKPPRAKCTIVFFGGFDSYIEELTSAFAYLRDAGYDVIAFDGPGQGGALNEAGLTMTAEWHKPVGAVLDYFEVERAALVGRFLTGGHHDRRKFKSVHKEAKLPAQRVHGRALHADNFRPLLGGGCARAVSHSSPWFRKLVHLATRRFGECTPDWWGVCVPRRRHRRSDYRPLLQSGW